MYYFTVSMGKEDGPCLAGPSVQDLTRLQSRGQPGLSVAWVLFQARAVVGRINFLVLVGMSLLAPEGYLPRPLMEINIILAS